MREKQNDINWAFSENQRTLRYTPCKPSVHEALTNGGTATVQWPTALHAASSLLPASRRAGLFQDCNFRSGTMEKTGCK